MQGNTGSTQTMVINEGTQFRHLTDVQKQQIKNILTQAPGAYVGVVCFSPDADGCVYATEIEEILRDGGWSVPGGLTLVMASPPARGIWVEISPAEKEVQFPDLSHYKSGEQISDPRAIAFRS